MARNYPPEITKYKTTKQTDLVQSCGLVLNPELDGLITQKKMLFRPVLLSHTVIPIFDLTEIWVHDLFSCRDVVS